MTTARLTTRAFLLAVLAAAAVATLAGCHAIDFQSPALQEPVPPPMMPPRELDMVSLPSYRIEPPDVLQIEMLKMVPLPPYRVEIYDVLQIQVLGTLLDQPIDDFYLVEGEGTVNLGPSYGTVRVVGMTVEESKKAVDAHLRQALANPEVSVKLARTAGTQPVSGQYLVGPDGTVNLRKYGAVHVAGRSIRDAREALEKHLARFFDSPEVTVDVLAYNSKVYYVITQGAGMGDNVARVPITGNETVLDAISRIGGISQLSSKEIWIARPAPGESNCEQILPVDYAAITQGGSAATNYQLMPGDRVFVAQDNLLAANNFLGKLTGPIERLLGITSLGSSTMRSLQTMGRQYNLRRGSGY